MKSFGTEKKIIRAYTFLIYYTYKVKVEIALSKMSIFWYNYYWKFFPYYFLYSMFLLNIYKQAQI